MRLQEQILITITSLEQDLKVNVLQRRMFAAGDVAASKQNILPLYEKHAKGNPKKNRK